MHGYDLMQKQDDHEELEPQPSPNCETALVPYVRPDVISQERDPSMRLMPYRLERCMAALRPIINTPLEPRLVRPIVHGFIQEFPVYTPHWFHNRPIVQHVGRVDRLRSRIIEPCVPPALRFHHLLVHAIDFGYNPLFEHNRNTPVRDSSVYMHSQNVHASSVTESVTKSIMNLKTDPTPDFDMVLDHILTSGLSAGTKESLIRFCDDCSEDMKTDMTYSMLFSYVWQRIQNLGETDERLELERILEGRIEDSIDEDGEDLCFGGRLSRLVSVLDGFFDDVRISISDNERITAIVLQVRDSLDIYDARLHLDLVTEQLVEAGFTADQFEPWAAEIRTSIEPEPEPESEVEIMTVIEDEVPGTFTFPTRRSTGKSFTTRDLLHNYRNYEPPTLRAPNDRHQAPFYRAFINHRETEAQGGSDNSVDSNHAEPEIPEEVVHLSDSLLELEDDTHEYSRMEEVD